MIVLDTTVLVYAKGADHPLRDPCRRLIGAIAAGEVEATTTPEVIQEFMHVRARRHDRPGAATLARDYAELLSPLLLVDRPQLERGLLLFEAVTSLGAFDAVLAAAAIAAAATHLVSADSAFGEVKGLDHVEPDAAGIATLIG